VLLDYVLAAILDKTHHGGTIAIDTAKFLAPVLPDQQVAMHLDPTGPGIIRFTCDVERRTVLHGRVRLLPHPP
jgi:hypothetical protein